MVYMPNSRAQQDAISFVNFNQDSTCISVGTQSGFKIFNCDPFGKCFAENDGGIAIVEMLYCSSLVAVVGIGEQPWLSPRRLKMINTKEQTKQSICELTFPTAILKVKLNRRRLVVLLEDQIYIYDISNMRLLHTIETWPNPNGVCALSESCYLAYPSPAPPKGGGMSTRNNSGNNENSSKDNNSTRNSSTGSSSIGTAAGSMVSSSPNRAGDVVVFDTQSLQPVNVIEAHKSHVQALAFNGPGTLLATASDKGTIVRVFKVPNAAKVQEFRRGTYASKIYSMNFNSDSSLLVVSSATETVHVFRISGGGTGGAGGGGGGNEEGISGNNNNNNNNTNNGPLQRRGWNLATGYLPSVVTKMWEPQRAVALAKIPAGGGGGAGGAGRGGAGSGGGSGTTKSQRKSVVSFNGDSSRVFVITGEGYFYQFRLNSKEADEDGAGGPAGAGAGGSRECELVQQYSLGST